MRRAPRSPWLVAAMVAVAAAVAAVVGAALGCPRTGRQPEACKVVIDCYFSPEKGPDHDLGSVLPGLDDPALFVSTFGPEGSCWQGDKALAHSCEDRCRGLLAEDCSFPYPDGGTTAYCQGACDFAAECSTQINPADGKPASSRCPLTQATRSVEVDGGVQDRFVPEPCSVTTPRGDGSPAFGCCLLDGGVPGDCAYENTDPADCRDPPGNPAGLCPGDSEGGT